MSLAFSRRVLFRGAAERLALIALASRAAACTGEAPGVAAAGAPKFLSPKQAAVLVALAETLLPRTAVLDVNPGETELVARVDRFLAAGDKLTADQFAYLLTGFEHYPLFFTTHFRRFTALAPAPRAEVLATFSESRYYAKRMIFTALKSVVCNHYFADPGVQAKLGYAPACRW